MQAKNLPVISVLLTAVSMPSFAQQNHSYNNDYMTISGFVGSRFSSDELKDKDTDATATFDSDISQAIALGWRYEQNSEGELLFSNSRQKMSMSDDSVTDLDIDVQYLHFGGRVMFKNNSPFSTSIGLGIGGTHFNPGSGYDSEFALSGSISGGMRYELTEQLALRGDLRVYGTLLNSSSSLFCNGDNTCVLSIDGDVYVQADLMAGLEYKF